LKNKNSGEFLNPYKTTFWHN